MNTNSLWPVAVDAIQALGRQYDQALEQVAAALNLSEWYGWLLAALTFEPEPISAFRLGVRNPYTSARLFNARLKKAAELGLLTPVEEEDTYCLTDLGRQAGGRIIAVAYAQMAALQPLPTAEVEHLASLLHRWVTACLVAPEPPGKWCILHSRHLDPGDSVPTIARIDQYLSDLAAYRDDAHLAAWQAHHIEGHTWEAFTCLWREGTKTLDGLYQKLIWRGHSQEEYQQALDDLVRRGWILEQSGEYALTDLGQEIRRASEQATDQYFYVPLWCLSQGEVEELRTLLNHLYKGLTSVPES